MRFDVVTIFPAMFDAVSEWGISSRALQRGLWQLHRWNPRDYARDDWPDDICRRFGSWLATHLTTKDTPMSTVEAEHWHGVLSQEMRLLRREMADYA